MSELSEKVKMSIERLKAFEPEEGYFLAFSGGKDSVACKALLDMAGCKYDAKYRVTSVDPPELVRFIKKQHPDVYMEIPRYENGKPITMWNLIPWKTIPPTRLIRYCCQYLKESAGDGRKTVTGVRWAESVNRKKNQGLVTVIGREAQKELDNSDFKQTQKLGVILVNDNEESRRMVEQCYKRHRTNINPIIDWEDSDVWNFIKANGVPYCSLYDEGFHRLGCIGCPMAATKSREMEFQRYPKYREAYIRAFDKMLQVRKEKGKPFRAKTVEHPEDMTAIDVFNWWMEYDVLPGQINLFEEEGL